MATLVSVQHGCWRYEGIVEANGTIREGSLKLYNQDKLEEDLNEDEADNLFDVVATAYDGPPYKGMKATKTEVA